MKCPSCGSINVTSTGMPRRWQCMDCDSTFAR
ncbi:hypothetical protein [Streptomyces sp. DSM 41886]|uniref:IS1 family transposase n=1 Tax=Streptomyces johnsoniae TaxID=3075532 RepID=A0ABU2S1V8_9ACTN|nr:hypothetical protein [Streptomyces sp. DSM 41886]MDT0441779.1 hypothetical protein [Streptomyces sp. DSM 41886]ONK13712.1 hypothetical protein STBA_44850 [Streptomyces sp. MP131-18]